MNLRLKVQVDQDDFRGIVTESMLAVLKQVIPDYKSCLRIIVTNNWVNYHLHKAIGSKMYDYQFYIFSWKGLTDEQFYILRKDNG